MSREGRKKAVRNLLNKGIDRLVIIGGDGSLYGANILHNEWPELIKEIVEEDKLEMKKGNVNQSTKLFDESILQKHSFLTIIGIVGSIDNDMAGTDLTVGADSSLNVILRALDALQSTAASHQRDFVVEVMGRDCGWLGKIQLLITSYHNFLTLVTYHFSYFRCCRFRSRLGIPSGRSLFRRLANEDVRRTYSWTSDGKAIEHCCHG